MITVNGEDLPELRATDTVATVLERLDLAARTAGMAVAVNGEVVPRSAWRVFTLGEDASVEVLGAMQGG